MPTQFLTDLPDEDQPVLGNGVEDEVALDRETAPTNYGSVRVHYRETGASSWIDWGVVPYDRLDPVITGLEDGERYEVRLRTETEHVLGEWTESVAITTKFPGATNLQITGSTETGVNGEFTDNADNEDGFDIGRREQFRDGWGEWRTALSLGPNSGTGTVQWTDNNAQPDTTYEYRIEAYTEHSSATTSAVGATTTDDGVRTDRVPAQGWHVVVEREDGVTVSPTIVGEPTVNRKLNDQPTCEIPVTQHSRWSEDEWGGADMRVYEDGVRQPIEELRRPREEPEQVTLVGVGGVNLEERVTIDVIERDAHLTADDVVAAASDYVRNVDDPAGDPSADVLQESVDSTTEWAAAVGSDANQPWTVRDDGSLEPTQTAGFYEAEGDNVTQYITEFTATDLADASATRAERINQFEKNNSPSGFSFTFETEHTIPLSEFGVAVRVHYTGSGDHHAYYAEVDGTEIGLAGMALNVTNDQLEWFQTTDSTLSGTLDPGEHTVQIRAGDEATGVDDPGAFWDALAWYDNRYPPGFTEQVTDGVIEGPDEYPVVPAETADVTTVRQVVGGRLDITSGMASPELALSNDNGATFPVTATDATSVEGQFSEGSGSLRARITLTGYNSNPTVSPAGRTAPQSVDAYELFADLDDTPLLVNRSFSGSARDILVDVADYANALWEVTWDEAAGSIAIEWTQPGQRTADIDPDLVDYSIETDYGSVHRKAVIKGNQVPASTESMTAQHDTWVALDHDWLAEVGETVTDDSGTEYDRGVDYELRPECWRDPAAVDWVDQ